MVQQVEGRGFECTVFGSMDSRRGSRIRFMGPFSETRTQSPNRDRVS